jgi:hypothetical protein
LIEAGKPMGFFKSLKGEGPERIGGEEGSQDQQQRSSEKRRLFDHSSSGS